MNVPNLGMIGDEGRQQQEEQQEEWEWEQREDALLDDTESDSDTE